MGLVTSTFVKIRMIIGRLGIKIFPTKLPTIASGSVVSNILHQYFSIEIPLITISGVTSGKCAYLVLQEWLESFPID